MKYLFVSLCLIFALVGCDLIEVVDIKPTDSLTEDGVFKTSSGAERALAGAYAGLTDGTLDYWLPCITSMGIGTMGTSLFSSFSTNLVQADDFLNSSIYQGHYTVLNRAAYVVENVAAMNETLFKGKSKQEVLAEARFLRAFSHFNLLQSYGQFWDMESPYGIVLRKEGARSVEAHPRSTVSQSYDLILEDLDFAIDHLPKVENPIPYFANYYAALALKAKVQLYRGAFAESAKLSKQVIDESPFTLEANYEDIFQKQQSSVEMLFCAFADADDEYDYSVTLWGAFLNVSTLYEQIATGENDTRIGIVTGGPAPNLKFSKGIIENTGYNNTQYYIRLAEVYLIYAEALARSNGSLTDPDNLINDVEDALNTIRGRADMPNSTATNRAGFLEAIRIEKLLELATETGEPWYDLIRYAVLDGLDISAIKPAVVSEYQYILPIPTAEINTSNGIVVQNPQ